MTDAVIEALEKATHALTLRVSGHRAYLAAARPDPVGTLADQQANISMLVSAQHAILEATAALLAALSNRLQTRDQIARIIDSTAWSNCDYYKMSMQSAIEGGACAAETVDAICDRGVAFSRARADDVLALLLGKGSD